MCLYEVFYNGSVCLYSLQTKWSVFVNPPLCTLRSLNNCNKRTLTLSLNDACGI